MDPLDIPKAYAAAVEHYKAGRLSDAEAIYRRILALHPEIVEVRNNLGITLADQERTREAIEEYRQALALKPDFAEAWNNLGNALRKTGDIAGAVDAFLKATSAAPTFATALHNLGLAYEGMFRPDLAVDAYRRLVGLRPRDPDAHYNLANVLKESAQIDAAVDEYETAISLRPDFVEAHHNLATALKDAGRLDDSLAEFTRAQDLRPNAFTAGSILCTAHFHPAYDARRLSRMHAEWNRQYAEPLAPASGDFPNVPDPERRLRIGYVSPDFREHPVGRFFLPLAWHHDRNQFEVFCYTDVARPDAITDAIKSRVDIWQPTRALSDEQLADLIRRDRIDILIDLAMHMKANRLLAFARKPAPVQVTYLAYCSTTGLTAIDYRLSDAYLDPPGADESVYSEKTFRLPRTYWCYPRPDHAPDVTPSPLGTTGHVTFGCLNNFCKVTSVTLGLWRDLLTTVPDSHLILHALEGRHRQTTIDFFPSTGINSSRVEFVGQLPLRQYLEQYNRIDIALDPFPYGGGTTTCDALYAGVPVVTLTGDTAVSRGGSSILSNLNHPELIATDPRQYLDIAASLASNPSRLAQYRSSLRGQMESSPLMNSPAFAKDIEAALRSMWRAWCDSLTRYSGGSERNWRPPASG
jgi:predicted O-linked N-acetylglucosamine transferase (SPINDLY family)